MSLLPGSPISPIHDPNPPTLGTSSSLVNYTTIPSPPTACIFAEMRYGSNGSTSGAAELLLGNNGSDASIGRITWDGADSGSFDSGEVAFGLVIPAGGGSPNQDSLAVFGAVTNPVNYGLATYGTIIAVVIEAGVQINAAVAVTGLSVQFYKAGTQTDTYNLASGPAVDTTTAPNPVAAQVLTITPGHSDNDSVQILGSIQLTAPDGTFPGADDLFVQIFIQTASCSQ